MKVVWLMIVGALVLLLWLLDCVAAGFVIWTLSILFRFPFTLRIAAIGGSVLLTAEGAYSVYCCRE